MGANEKVVKRASKPRRWNIQHRTTSDFLLPFVFERAHAVTTGQGLSTINEYNELYFSARGVAAPKILSGI
jgi:hypothetical protein